MSLLTLKRTTVTIKQAETLVGKYTHTNFPGFEPINDWFATDTETTDLDPWGRYGLDRATYPARPFAFSFCNEDGATAYIRFPVDPMTRRVIKIKHSAVDYMESILKDESITKVFFNSPFDIRMYEMMGFKIRGNIEDAMFAMHTISPDELNGGLKALSNKYLNIDDADEKDLHQSAISGRAWAKLQGFPRNEEIKGDYYLGNAELCEKYACLDAYRTAALWMVAKEELEKDQDLLNIYNREIKLSKAIYRMESRGVRVDKPKVEECVEFYNEIKKEHSLTIVAEAGPEFNPNSPQQMHREFLGKRGFKPLSFCIDKKTKQRTKHKVCDGEGCDICDHTGHNPQTNADFLEVIGVDKDYKDEKGNTVLKMKDRLAWALLHESAADTMLGYLKNYSKYMVETLDGWVIHPNYKQSGTKTGRLSAEKPNLQNVASDDSGKKKTETPYRSRECFIPRDGFVYYIPDYSQIEIWILFIRARCSRVLLMLANGGDAHQIIANDVWGDLYDSVNAKVDEKLDSKSLSKDRLDNLKAYKKARKKAKNLQFCKVYGGGPAKVAAMIGDGCTTDQANEFISQYDQRLPEVKTFMATTIRIAKQQGWIKNAYGRRYIIDPKFAYRATNYDIQGSAADLIKNAMIYCDNLQQTEKYDQKLFMLLTVHDELLFEVHSSIDNKETREAICECMSRDYKFLGCPVPFPIGMKVAIERWSTEVKV